MHFEAHNSVTCDLSRLALASLVIWLAVTTLVTCEATAVSVATAGATAALPQDAARADQAIAAVDDQPLTIPSAPSAATEQALAVVAEPGEERPPVVAAAATPSPAAASAGFSFPVDLGGQLLSERLIPPAMFDLPAVPFVDAPQPWRGVRFDPVPRDVPPLTTAVLPRDPRPFAHSELAGLSARDADLPHVARDAIDRARAPIRLHPQSKSFVPSADPNEVPFLPISSAPPRETILASSDPARDSAAALLFGSRAAIAATPTPFIKLSIPDPFEQVRAIQLTRPIADLDAPLFPTSRPSTPRGNP